MAESITIPSPSVFLRAASPASPKPASSQPKHERKRSTTVKRNNAASATKKKLDGGLVTKPKQSKSRNGCVTCKAKRLKCDESKPSCEQCKRRNVDCEGYKKDYKWRPFDEPVPKPTVTRPKKGTQSNSRPQLNKTSTDGTNDEHDEAIENRRRALKSRSSTVEPCQELAVHAQDHANTPAFAQQVFTPPDQDMNIDPMLASFDASPPIPTASLQDIQDAANDEHEANHMEGLEHDHFMAEAGAASMSAIGAPSDLDTAFHFSLASTPNQLDFVTFDTPDLGMFDYFIPQDVDVSQQHPEGDEVEEIARRPSRAEDEQLTALAHISPSSNSSGSSEETTTPAFPTFLTNQPSFAMDAPEMMTMRFDRFTCGILSVKDGPTENPWRTLIWPMAQASPALFNAIVAMSAYHSSRDIPQLRIAGHKHVNASVSNLTEGMQQGTVKLNSAIATTLALAFAESWNQHTTSGNAHIKGARAMINEALNRHRVAPLSGIRLARLKFLCNSWVYMDVIARLTSTDEDESDDYDRIFSLYSSPNPHSGFGIDFGMPIDAQLDPLMGCAGTMFPLIGRVANLVRRVRRSPSNTAPIITQAMELKLLVETWDPPEFIEPPEDPTSNVQHSLQTAEAYRWATLLYLHQAVPEIPSPSASDMAKKVMVYLATVPLVSRFVIVHIFPMMAAGCEAYTLEDREWVRTRWQLMGQRLRIGSIDKCLEVTEEVWRRRDQHERRPTNVRALVSTADLRNSGGEPPTQLRRGSSFSTVGSPSEDIYENGEGRSNNRRRGTMRRASDHSAGSLEREYSIKGRLHWLGVMKDWDWEILLG